MRLAEDRRARVPFALVAVLLLVSSTAFATALSTREPPRVDRAVDDSMDRIDAESRLAIRAAVDDAARAAAREPVVTRSATSAGSVLNESGTFRDALRLRIYLRARDHLSTARYRHEDVTAHASLPPTPNETALRAAKRRVDVESVANGTALRATVENVTLSAERDNQTVATQQAAYAVTVDSPVLALHDRATRFETRLNRGPAAGPGLGRQLTARLYPVAWSRGALQYGGAPIQNVVTNRHVALAANGGVLASQRAAFGRADPDANAAYDRAANRAMLTDVLAPTPVNAERTADAVLRPPVSPRNRSVRPDNYTQSPDAGGLQRSSAVDPDDELVVGVNRSADRALLTVHEDEPGIERIIDEQYRATVRLETRVERVRDPDPVAPSPPGENWTLSGSDTRETTRVEQAPAPLPPTDGRRFQTATRKVVQRIVVERTWRRGGETTRTSSERTRVTRVGIAVVGEHDPPGRAPDRSVDPLFDHGGAIDGPNLASVEDEASTMIDDRGGADALAQRAATDDSPDHVETVTVDPPAAVEPWVREDLTTLRTEVRNVSVSVERGTVAAGRANPPRRLAATLRDRRDRLVATPETYDGVADRARVATRAAYLDAVIADLETRARKHERANEQLKEIVSRRGTEGAPPPGEAIENRPRAADPDRRSIGGGRTGESAPGRNVTVVPNGEPAYLTRSAVRRGPVADPSPPLATRNINVFTVPYGDAVDAVADEVSDDGSGGGAGGRVALDTAGRTLITANQTLATQSNQTLEARRDKLNGHLAGDIMDARSTASDVLGAEDAVDAAAAESAIAAAHDRFDGRGHLAVAIANGTYADVVADEAAVRSDLSDAERVVLAAHLRVRLAEETASATVPAASVETTSTSIREIASEVLRAEAKEAAGNVTAQAAERALGDGYRGIPAGLPLLPIPGYWIATINVWHVQVRGTYARFTLHARDGTPDRPGGTTYVRDGSSVAVDVDGDGTAERLGRSDRIAFETSTVVVIAVPPSGRGVGDVDGNAIEESAGWPCPGPAGEAGESCPESSAASSAG